MIDHTTQTLALWRSVPFSYATGQDCLMSLADHVLRSTGRDFGTEWRGRYSTEAEAMAHVAAYGGPARMIERSGLKRTQAPRRGDILIARIGKTLLGGVHTGDGVAFRTLHGVIEFNARLVKPIACWIVE